MNALECTVTAVAGLLATLAAPVFDLPAIIVITSYPLCFMLGYAVGHRHRCHGP